MNIFQLIRYYLSQTYINIKYYKFNILLGVITIATVIFIFGFFLVLNTYISTLIDSQEAILKKMYIYLKAGVSASQAETLRKEITESIKYSKLEFYNSESARKNFVKILGNQSDLLQGVSVPAYFILEFEKGVSELRIQECMDDLKNNQYVEEVNYEKELLNSIKTVRKYLATFGVLISIILLVASLLIISNSIRLSLYSRVEEIEIMKLFGATDMFISIPYIIEGLIQGILGSVIAITVLYYVLIGIFQYIYSVFPLFTFITDIDITLHLILIFIIGMTIGGLGSLLSVKGRLINLSNN